MVLISSTIKCLLAPLTREKNRRNKQKIFIKLVIDFASKKQKQSDFDVCKDFLAAINICFAGPGLEHQLCGDCEASGADARPLHPGGQRDGSD